jgi:hypothetical protein
MNNTLKSMLIAAAALTAVSSFAQDKATLDLLVKKGLITAEERAKTLDESSQARVASGVGRVFPKEDATKRLTISGYFQTQFQSFGSSYTTGSTGAVTTLPSQQGFIMRRLYVELLADVGEGISGNLVMDISGNTTSSASSWIDRAMLSYSDTYGSFDLGYRKVAWGYEESTLSSLFKASSSKLLTVERGITNRYWNEAEKNGRLGFGAHHVGLFYNSVVNPQGFEYGLAVTNGNRDFTAAGKGQNDLGYYANLVWNNKVSDNEKYAIGVNYGKNKFFDATAAANKNATMEGYNPFVQVQYFNWTAMGEYMSTKLNDTKDGAARDHKPEGYNATVVYKINDNFEGVVRYTKLDTDGRGLDINTLERDYANGAKQSYTAPTTTYGNTGNFFNKSDAWYLGVNYYFTLNALGTAVYGPNAKIQFGYERANFNGTLGSTASATGAAALNGVVTSGNKAKVDAIRLQAQIAF